MKPAGGPFPKFSAFISLSLAILLSPTAKLASMVTTKIGKGDIFGQNLPVQQDQMLLGNVLITVKFKQDVV